MRRGARAALVAVALALPSAAQEGAETGEQAFERRDYAAAAALWREEAAAGSARAQLGLGVIADLGLGAPRDPAKALRWYLEAAEGGLAEAQFNVGVMLDAGAGVPRDVAAASVWYARAAAQGHRRAQYNLGLLHEAGEGVPRNADLARHWLGRAAEELAAAGERLAGLAPVEPGERSLVAPAVLADAVVTVGGRRRAELVWSAPPGPAGAPFLVEVARVPGAGETSGRLVVSRETDASALAVDLPPGPGGHVWRVSRVDEEQWRYAASPWRRIGAGASGGGVSGEAAAAPPGGRVTFRVREGDAFAGLLAEELADSLTRAGLWTRIERADGAPSESAVRYAFAEDAGLAADIADFLPVLGRDDAVRTPASEVAPGEVVVWLVGGSGEAGP